MAEGIALEKEGVWTVWLRNEPGDRSFWSAEEARLFLAARGLRPKDAGQRWPASGSGR